MAAATPTTTRQRVRSLGVPVKSSEKRAPTEAEAYLLNLINPTPTTRKASPRRSAWEDVSNLWICYPLGVSENQQRE
jgi:hypothetical protein